MLQSWLLAALLAAQGGQYRTETDMSRVGMVLHRVVPGESLEEVAERHGVERAELDAWNPELGREPSLIAVKPRLFSPPRQKRPTWIQNPTTWEELAERFSVTVEQLETWNGRLGKRRRPPHHRTLSVWIESGLGRWPYPWSTHVPELPTVEDGGRSIGRPSLGRLEDGVPLPESPDYVIRIPDQAFGSSYAVEHLVSAIADFRHQTGFDGPIYIGAISRAEGGKLPPHGSHQSGRDVDIRLPALPFAFEKQRLSTVDVDCYATWVLLDAIHRTGAVDVIFLEKRFHRRLRSAAEELGAPQARIDAVMAKLMHVRGHRGHMHVRFACGPDEDRCTGEHRL